MYYYINNNTMNIIDTVRGHRKIYFIVARFVKNISVYVSQTFLGSKYVGNKNIVCCSFEKRIFQLIVKFIRFV